MTLKKNWTTCRYLFLFFFFHFFFSLLPSIIIVSLYRTWWYRATYVSHVCTCVCICVYVYACTKRVTRKLARTCFTIVESFLFLFNHFFFSNVFLADIYIFTLNHLRRRPITYATDGRTLYTYTLDIWFYLSNVPMRTSIIEKIRDRTRYTIMNTTCMRGNITLFNAVERL